jgi:hypothetical protein
MLAPQLVLVMDAACAKCSTLWFWRASFGGEVVRHYLPGGFVTETGWIDPLNVDINLDTELRARAFH